MADDAAPNSTGGAAGATPIWNDADVTRAIRAAGKAGLQHYRVEIAPDGTISIVVEPSRS